MKLTFNGYPKRLNFFLNQVWVHLDCYLDGAMMVNAVAANLEGEAANWVTNLHDDGAPELNDINLFMEQLRDQLEDESQVLMAKKEIHRLKQRGRPAKEYIHEFRRVANRLGQSLERSLIDYFKQGLDRDCQCC
ncbi:interleukin-4 receptor subunit alpha [Crotalus adamanteus]|uniref:Interleukin-4 receptor subunit alpha n=1 Tax=Crotalus adamanteus TaxID=8729 RepID=A0AAW1B0Q3_CROAD